jgi:hypothetical protein
VTLTSPLAAAMATELPWRELPQIVTARFAADSGFVGAALEAWRSAAGRDVADVAAAVMSATWDRGDEVVRP